eukprot:641906-Prorocentrum_lima.AAC.1
MLQFRPASPSDRQEMQQHRLLFPLSCQAVSYTRHLTLPWCRNVHLALHHPTHRGLQQPALHHKSSRTLF